MSRLDDPIPVLYVDSDRAARNSAVAAFERTDDRFEVVTAGSAEEASERLTAAFDCVVAAESLPERDGPEFLCSVCAERPCVLFTPVDPAEQAPIPADIDEVVRAGEESSSHAVLAASVVALVTRHRAGQQGGYRREQFRQVTADLERLHQAANRLYAADSVEDSYEITIDTAVDILGLDWCSLMAPADDADLFEIKAISEQGTVEVGYRPFGTDEGVAGEVYQTKETRIVDDVRNADRARPTDSSIRSGMVVPVGDWGVFQAMANSPDAFDERDQNWAELLCTSLATAVERNQREQELTAQNNRLEEFASIVSHDLRSPLNALSMALELAEETGESEFFDRCQRSVDRMNQLVEVLLTLARAGEDIDTLEPVDLSTVVETAWETVETRDAQLVVDTDLRFRADRLRLEQLLTNLFRNSIEHGSPDDHLAADSSDRHRPARNRLGADDSPTGVGDLTVTVSDIEGGFAVEDDGPGIPPDQREEVFEAGYSTAADGTGFGLRIVARVVEAHGWTVRVTDGTDGGARFEITGVDDVA